MSRWDYVTNCKECGEFRKCRNKLCHKCRYAKNREKHLEAIHRKRGYRFKIDTSKCELCGVLAENAGKCKFILVHHIDCNPKNNDVSNLQALCMSCHGKLHSKLDRWDKTNANNPLKKKVNGKWVGNVEYGPCKYCGKKTSIRRIACDRCKGMIRHESNIHGLGPVKHLSEEQRRGLYNERKARKR